MESLSRRFSQEVVEFSMPLDFRSFVATAEIKTSMKETKTIRIGTRGSPLAVAQTGLFAAALRDRHPGLATELVKIKTSGDKIQDRFLNSVGGKGLFTKEIEEALLAGTIDLAVHSLKDLPAEIPDGLTLACFPRRLSHEDVLVTPDGVRLEDLPKRALIGTVSLRRRLQLERRRPDLTFALLRGNIDSRLRRLEAGEFAGIILAQAGIERLNLPAEGTPLGLIPAPGQGCLGIEINIKNNYLKDILKPLHDAETATAVQAERFVMRALGGSCNLPLGALGRVRSGRIRLQAFLASPDGSRWLEAEREGEEARAETLASELVEALFAGGAQDILDAIHHEDAS